MAATTLASPPREYRRVPLATCSVNNATPMMKSSQDFSLVRKPRDSPPPSCAPTVQSTVSQPFSSNGSNPAFLSSRAVGSGKRYRGVVVYYTTTKGFGFAHTEKPEVWKIYVHIYALEKCGVTDLEVGMELEFNVRENHKGKYACNVCPVVRDAGGHIVERDCLVAIPILDGRHVGTLKSFDSQRLFGWVMCGETEVFMTIYELRQDNMEQHLVPGTILEFSIGKHGRGPTAYDIDILQSARPMFSTMPSTAPQQPMLVDAGLAATLSSMAALLQAQATATMMNQQLQQLALGNPFSPMYTNLCQGSGPMLGVSGGQDAMSGGMGAEPLLKLPSMSTHSPLMGRPASWDDVAALTDGM